MKTTEELNALRSELEALNAKLAGLTEDELLQITGGGSMKQRLIPPIIISDGND